MNQSIEDLGSDLSKWQAAAERGEVKLVAIVRDSLGRPKFDDPLNVPQEILDALTADDLEYLEVLKNQIQQEK